MTAAATIESDEDVALRRTVAGIAERCRESRGAESADHANCWAAIERAGLTELRSADESGAALATTGQVVIVVEELAKAVCGAPLVGVLIANELARLAAVSHEVDGVTATVLLAGDLHGVASDDPALAWDAGAPVTHALGIRGDELILVPLGEARPTQDLSRPVAGSGGDARVLTSIGADALTEFEAFSRIVLAADLLGASAAALASAVEYSGQRVQFGQPIATFQAVQHVCARAHVKVEAQRSALLFAAWSHDSGGVDRFAPAVAKAYANRAAIDVVEAAIQVFGGVAITWEHHAHRHLRRVLLDAEVFGRTADLETHLLDLVDGASDGLQ